MRFLNFLPILLVACADHEGTTYQNGQIAAHYRSRTLMTDFNAAQYSPGMTIVTKQNQSRVPVQLIRSGERVIGYGYAFKTSEVLSNNSTREVLGGQLTTRSIAEGKEITKRFATGSAAQTEQLRIVTPKQ